MENKKWVAGWGTCENVTTQTIADHIEDITFRYVIYPTLDADALRLHFSNLRGTEKIKVNSVFVARRDKWKAAVPGTSREVYFGGSSGFEL